MPVIRERLERGGAPSPAQREWIAAWGLGVLALAQQRITKDELAEVGALLQTLPETSEAGSIEPMIRVWVAICRATHEPEIVQTAEYWAGLARARTRGRRAEVAAAHWPIPKATYRGLLLALRRGSGAPELWSRVMDELFGSQS